MMAVLAAVTYPAMSASAGTSAMIIGTENQDNVFRGLVTACDAGYLLGGTHQDKKGSGDMFISHFGDNSDLLWSVNFTGSGNEVLREIKADCDSNSYLITGLSATGSSGGPDMYAARINLTGHIQSQILVGAKQGDVAHGIDPTPDGGFIMAGYRTVEGDKDYAIVKVSSSNTIDWQVSLRSPGGDDVIREVKALSDGTYMVAGFSRSQGENGNIWVVRLDSNGSVLWQNLYGGSGFEEASTIIEAPDGGIIVMEETRSFTATQAGWVFKIDRNNGTILRQVLIDGSDIDELSAAVMLENNTILAVGEVRSASTSDKEDYWIVTMDQNFTLLSQKRIGTVAVDEAETLALLSNASSIVIAGRTTEPVSHGGNDILVVTIGMNGTIIDDSQTGIITHNMPTDAVTLESTAVAVQTNKATVNPQWKVKPGTLVQAFAENDDEEPLPTC